MSEEDKECCCSHNRCRLEQPLAGDTHRDDGFVVLRYAETVTIYTGTQLCSPAYLHALKVANGKYWLIGNCVNYFFTLNERKMVTSIFKLNSILFTCKMALVAHSMS